jgi:branched-chain amino acid aminotransferase
VLTHGLHYASAVFEGERAYGGRIFKLTEHNQRLHESAEILGFKIPYSVAELDAACSELLKRQGFSGRLCAPDRLARLGDDGRFGAEQPHQRRDRHLAVAELFQSGREAEGHPPRHRRVPPAGPEAAPSKSKAAGLYMICTLSKHAAEPRAMPMR